MRIEQMIKHALNNQDITLSTPNNKKYLRLQQIQNLLSSSPQDSTHNQFDLSAQKRSALLEEANLLLDELQIKMPALKQ